MKATKRAGIWMDHATAHIIAFPNEGTGMETLESAHISGAGHAASDGDKHLHNKEQGLETGFYKHLGEVIKGYEEVLLFGPADAKVELFNLLRKDSHFDKIRIDTETSGKMTPNQMYAHVTKHFQPDIL